MDVSTTLLETLVNPRVTRLRVDRDGSGVAHAEANHGPGKCRSCGSPAPPAPVPLSTALREARSCTQTLGLCVYGWQDGRKVTTFKTGSDVLRPFNPFQIRI